MKTDVYKIMADRMIDAIKDAIENGTPAPWHKPWNAAGAHMNIASGTRHSRRIALVDPENSTSVCIS